MKTIVLRIEEELYERVEEKASGLYLKPSAWIKLVVVESVNEGNDGGKVGRPPLSEGEKKGREDRAKRSRFLSYQEESLRRQDGEVCGGSEKIWPRDPMITAGEWKFAVCGECKRSFPAWEEAEGLRVSRHRNGRQVLDEKGDLELKEVEDGLELETNS